MKYVFGLIVALAALLVGVNSGFELKQKYARAQNLTALSDIKKKNTFGIPVDTNADTNFVTDVHRFGSRVLSIRTRTSEGPLVQKYAVVPVVAYPLGTRPSSTLRLGRLTRNRTGAGQITKTPQGQPARICAGNYVIDFKIYNFETVSSKSLYLSPVAITQYETLSYGGRDDPGVKLLIVFIDEDTNKDGILTCNDRRKLAMYDLKADEYEVLDISLEPNALLSRHSYKDELIMSFGVDENEDGFFDATTERSEGYLLDIRNNKLISLTGIPEKLAE